MFVLGDNENDQSTFEKMYDKLKRSYLEDHFRVDEGARERYDVSVTFSLMKAFNDKSEYPMDRLERGKGMVRISEQTVSQNTEWNPNHSDNRFSDLIDKYNPSHKPEERTPEQQLSDKNATAYLNGQRNQFHAISEIIDATPSLKGLDVTDAVKLARADLENIGNPQDVLNKFLEADQSLVRATSYTLLHLVEEQKNGTNTDLGQELESQARSYMHYVTPELKEYQNWHGTRTDQVIKEIANDPELMEQLKQIKCPLNISTEEDLLGQRKLREEIADNVTNKMARAFGVDDILNEQDSTVVHLSRLNMLKQNESIGAMHSEQIGILNDETIILGYNPAYHILERDSFFMKTDQDEATFFLDTVIEETQHAIDNIQSDKLVLGTLDKNEPLQEHAAIIALNRLIYAPEGFDVCRTDTCPSQYINNDTGEKYTSAYANQYIEKTARNTASDISFEISFLMQNPDAHEKLLEQTAPTSETTVTNEPSIKTTGFQIN